MHREEVQRSKPEAMRPDEFRSEGTPSFSEWAERWGKPFWLLLRRLSKVTRRQGGTLSRPHRSNGYSPNQPEHGRPKGRQEQRPQKSPSKRGAPCTAKTQNQVI